jgi:hypothetical protein
VQFDFTGAALQRLQAEIAHRAGGMLVDGTDEVNYVQGHWLS